MAGLGYATAFLALTAAWPAASRIPIPGTLVKVARSPHSPPHFERSEKIWFFTK
jgi:hypothetical protein